MKIFEYINEFDIEELFDKVPIEIYYYSKTKFHRFTSLRIEQPFSKKISIVPNDFIVNSGFNGPRKIFLIFKINFLSNNLLSNQIPGT